jgi:hypothetical protein
MNFFKMFLKANKILIETSALSFDNNNNLKVCKIAFSPDKFKKAANFGKKHL